MITYYPTKTTREEHPIEELDKYGMTSTGAVYEIINEEYRAYYSPFLNRWVKGKMSGSTVRQNFLMLTHTQAEAEQIAQAVVGVAVESDEFETKLFLIADTVATSDNEPHDYLDELSDVYNCKKTQWIELSRQGPDANDNMFVVLENDSHKIFAVYDELRNLVSRVEIGDLECTDTGSSFVFSVKTKDGKIVQPTVFMKETLKYAYGIKVKMLTEEFENNFQLAEGFEKDDVLDHLKALKITVK